MQRVQAPRRHINGVLALRGRSAGTTAAAGKTAQRTIEWRLCPLPHPEPPGRFGPSAQRAVLMLMMMMVVMGRKHDEGHDGTARCAFQKLGFLSQDLEGHACVPVADPEVGGGGRNGRARALHGGRKVGSSRRGKLAPLTTGALLVGAPQVHADDANERSRLHS